MSDTPLAAPPKRTLSKATMASYGFGAAAYGVKDSGFGTFLLLFYNQVVGVPASTVGLVIMIALIVDAFVDPTVGFLSDRTRSRWGRRHPWMYAAALPIMFGWIALWNPPSLSEPMTLLYLFVVAVVVRSAVSAYEVPSQALTPELSGDYDERTRIMAYRYLFGWAGGLAMLISAYLYFLAPAPGYPNGLLNRAGYTGFALAGAAFMGLAILVSAAGTHREIKYLPNPPIQKQSLADSFRELGETLRNRAFLVLMAAGVFAYTSQGVGYAISNYLYSFVWGFRGLTFLYLSLSLFTGVLIAFVGAQYIGRHASKPRAATTAILLAGFFVTSPYWLRLLGLFPAVDSPWMLPCLFLLSGAGTMCGVTSYILGSSMMADVAEDSQSKTGRRSEGIFYAGNFFVQKCTSGIGIFVTGVILDVAGFPEKAVPGKVPVETLDRLTLIYICVYGSFAALAAFAYSRFPFGRSEHEARLTKLAAVPVPTVPET